MRMRYLLAVFIYGSIYGSIKSWRLVNKPFLILLKNLTKIDKNFAGDVQTRWNKWIK